MNKDISVQTRFKTQAECKKFIAQLNELDEKILSANLEDILKGWVDKKTLRSFIAVVSYNMKNNAAFQTPSDIYIANALNKISNKEDPTTALALHLDARDNDSVSITYEKIETGKIPKDILLKLISDTGYKIKNHPEFQYAPDMHVAEALIEIGTGKDPAVAFRLKKSSRNKNPIVDDKRIALRAWHRINIFDTKKTAVFFELASQFNKSESLIKKFYNLHRDKITRVFRSILRK